LPILIREKSNRLETSGRKREFTRVSGQTVRSNETVQVKGVQVSTGQETGVQEYRRQEYRSGVQVRRQYRSNEKVKFL